MLYQGDALRIPLKDGGVRLIVTSPPYFGLRSYTDEQIEIGTEPTHLDYLAALHQATAEMARVLSDDGNLFVNLGDRTAGAMANRNWEKISTRPPDYTKHESHRAGALHKNRDQTHATPDVPDRSLVGLPWRYALDSIDNLGLLLRQEIIWSKTNPMPDFSTVKRVQRSHEQLFHFTKQANSYATKRFDSEGKVMRPEGWQFWSVWNIAAGANSDTHTAAFPDALVTRIIEHWSEPTDYVLDPFNGSGTVTRIAANQGRNGLGGELDWNTLKLAAAEPIQMGWT